MIQGLRVMDNNDFSDLSLTGRLCAKRKEELND